MRFRARDNRAAGGGFAGWKPFQDKPPLQMVGGASLLADRFGLNVLSGWPDPGPIAESGARWIFCNVPDDSCERLTVSDKVIEILVLPKMALAAQHEVCFVRGVGFPGMKNRRKRAGSDRRKYGMDVVWHYARGVEAIAMLVEVSYGFEDDSCDTPIQHVCVALACIE